MKKRPNSFEFDRFFIAGINRAYSVVVQPLWIARPTLPLAVWYVSRIAPQEKLMRSKRNCRCSRSSTLLMLPQPHSIQLLPSLFTSSSSVSFCTFCRCPSSRVRPFVRIHGRPSVFRGGTKKQVPKSPGCVHASIGRKLFMLHGILLTCQRKRCSWLFCRCRTKTVRSPDRHGPQRGERDRRCSEGIGKREYLLE